MQSVCVTKAKAYYIIADGYTDFEAEKHLKEDYEYLTGE